MNIALERLQNQHLVGPLLKSPEDVVRLLGAVQAQDYAGAKWAIAQRTFNLADSDVDKAFDNGTILRTHVMRPTWHFILPADIRWMLKLTAPRVKALMTYYNKKLELSDAVFNKSNSLIAKALDGGNHLTRAELSNILESNGISAHGQRLGHLVMKAELDGVVCSGPRRGKQFTYALLEERAPTFKMLSRSKSLAKLASRYFLSHGPATLQDFAWWSGLTIADAGEGVELTKPKLKNMNEGNKTYWFKTLTKKVELSPTIHLLPNYDEYLISYKDYSPIFSKEVPKLAKPFGNALLAHIIVKNGLVIGGWRRELTKDSVIIKPDLLVRLSNADKTALKSAAEAYGGFLGLPATLSS